MFNISKAHDISILHLYGEISLLEMELIQNTLQSFKKTKHNKVLLDLAEVDHIHFKVVKKLASEAMAFRQENGDLKLVSPNDNTKLILKFTGADHHLKDYATVGEAILSFLKISTLKCTSLC